MKNMLNKYIFKQQPSVAILCFSSAHQFFTTAITLAREKFMHDAELTNHFIAATLDTGISHSFPLFYYVVHDPKIS